MSTTEARRALLDELHARGGWVSTQQLIEAHRPGTVTQRLQLIHDLRWLHAQGYADKRTIPRTWKLANGKRNTGIRSVCEYHAVRPWGASC